MAGKQKPQYVVTEVTVSGRGDIPVDMLRYDRCCPASGDDVTAVLAGLADRCATHRKVRLYRFSPDGSKATAARWLSFGWSVVSDTGS